MKRQFLAGVCVIVLSVLVGGAFGTYYSWDDGDAGDHYWSSPENWEPNGVPDFGDGVSIGGGFAAGEYPVIGSGFDANGSELSIVGSGAVPSLTLESGSSLTHLPYPDDGSSPILLLGSGWAPGQGILNNYGGDVVTRKLWVGYRDLGVLNMTGGTISVQGVAGDNWSGLLEVARGDDCPCPGDCNEYPGHGYVHLDGGVIECDALTLRMGYSNCPDGSFEHYEDANGFIDIAGGTLILDGVFQFDQWYADKVLGVSAVEQILQFELSGWLTAYGVGSMEDETIASHERARIVVDYGWRNEDKTTVTAMKHENNQAYDFYPAPYAENVSPLVVLSWKPGDYVAYGGEYMGSPDVKKGNGHHVFFGKLEDMQSYMNSWNPNYPVGTQYGHIVGANDVNRLDVGLLMPGGRLEGYTEYVWTVIEVNDANAPDGKWWWRAPLHYFRTRHICPECWDLGTVGIGAGEPLEMELSWWSGYYSADVNGYMVYFGTDFNGVNDANENDPEYMGTVSEPVWVATELELGQSYYWRADDVNEAGPPPYLWKGETCSFTIGDYRVVDEFDYESELEMWMLWQMNGWLGYIDPCCSENGSGAAIRYEWWGEMDYFYDNDGPIMGGDYFSEARYEYNEPVDWTYGDAETELRALALDYEGQGYNSTDPNYDRMWVAVEDANGNMAISPHPEPNAQQEQQWSTWNTDLGDFNDAGVDLERVKYLYIGFGVRCNPSSGTPGGEGMVTFDNIRLYPPRCVGLPGYRQAGDLNGDCIVNREDFGLLCSVWLMRDRIIDVEPIPDDDPNMLARWEFEGSYENDQYGTVGSVADGIGHGNPSIVVDETRPNSQPGNQVLHLDQDVNEYVDCNAGWADFNDKSFTVCGWVDQTESLDWAGIVTKGECEWKLQFGMLPWLENQIHFIAHATPVTSADVLENDIWHHVAASWDDVNHVGRVYIGGNLNAEEDSNAWPYRFCETVVEPRVLLGAVDEANEPLAASDYLAGYLDDVRVYDRLLSAGEVRWLANPWAWPECYEIQYPYKYANIYVDQCFWCCQRIDFKDFAVLAADWLESELWPAGEGP